jgi:hypothetical protein
MTSQLIAARFVAVQCCTDERSRSSSNDTRADLAVQFFSDDLLCVTQIMRSKPAGPNVTGKLACLFQIHRVLLNANYDRTYRFQY